MASVDYSYDFASLAKLETSKAIEAAKAKGGASPITVLALVLAVVAEKMTGNLLDLAEKLGNLKDTKAGMDKPGDMGETYLTALMQSETQMMSMFMQAMSAAIKALGEGETTVARK